MTARREVAIATAVTGAIALVIVAAWLSRPWPVAPGWTEPRGDTISAVYDPPHRGIEALLVKGDGQIFATQAMDPAVRRPTLIRGPESEQAYRFQRPLYPWVAWMASIGRSDLAPWALFGVAVAATAWLAGAVAAVARLLGRSPFLAPLIVLAPGVLIDLTATGPEALGAALVITGLWAWMRPERSSLVAVGCFALAGLTRETMLLAPAALALLTLVRRKRIREAVVLAAAAVPYVLWVLFLRWRIGDWPGGSVPHRLSRVPFGGVAAALGSWSAADVLVAVVLAVLAAAALRRRPPAELLAVLLAHVALAAFLGEAVFAGSEDFGRVLLPMVPVALIAMCPADPAVTPPTDDFAAAVSVLGRHGSPHTTR